MVITFGKARPGVGLRLGTLLLILSAAPLIKSGAAWAIDGGHHFDLTRDALVALGVPQDRDAIKVVQIQNVYCDLWEQANTVIDGALEYSWLILPAAVAGIWHLIFSPSEVRELSNRYLHFDDLSNYDQVEQEWNRLLINTYEAVQKARRDNDAIGLLTILGITLHKLQDFYAHSNWSHIDWDGDATWFDVPDEARRALARLPAYDIYTTGRPGWGHERLHKDNPSRAHFDKAYREAFYASVQWAQRVKDWAGNDLWNRAMRQSPANTEREHHFARYLFWYATTWKGPGLEEERSTVDMVALSLAYTNPAICVAREGNFLGKWKEYCRILTRRPALSRADYPARTFEMTYPERRKWLRLEINKAQQTDDDWIWDIDPGGEADFYTEVTVNGIPYLSGIYIGRDRVEFVSSPTYSSTWVTLAPLSVATSRVSVQVKLIDEDCIGGGAIPSLRGGDDLCDIHPHLGRETWSREFTAAELAHTQYIETDGFRYGARWYQSDGDGDEAKVEFNVGVSEPRRGGRPPVIRSVTPPQATIHSYSSVTIRGENFYPYARVHFGPGIPVHRCSIVSEQEIQVTIYIPDTVTPRVRACSVKTRCGSAAATFSVIPPPPAAPTSVTPSSCPRGASADVLIEGANFRDIERVTFGDGISVLGRPRLFEIRPRVWAIGATIRISREAQIGPRDVRVTQRLTEPGIGRGLFMVTEPPHTGPLITTVYPSSAEQGESLQVTIRGLGLTDVLSVRFGYDSDIAVRHFSEVEELVGTPPHMSIIRPGDAIEAFIVIRPRARIGDKTVTVSTRGGGRANGVFRVIVLLR